MNYLLKHVGLLLVAIGALMLIVGTFIVPDVWYSIHPFPNWYLFIIIILEVGGLVLHYVLNSVLPLEKIDDDEEDDNNQVQPTKVTNSSKPTPKPVEVPVKKEDKKEEPVQPKVDLNKKVDGSTTKAADSKQFAKKMEESKKEVEKKMAEVEEKAEEKVKEETTKILNKKPEIPVETTKIDNNKK